MGEEQGAEALRGGVVGDGEVWGGEVVSARGRETGRGEPGLRCLRERGCVATSSRAEEKGWKKAAMRAEGGRAEGGKVGGGRRRGEGRRVVLMWRRGALGRGRRGL